LSASAISFRILFSSLSSFLASLIFWASITRGRPTSRPFLRATSSPFFVRSLWCAWSQLHSS
jgi:hypothetical protein